MFKAIRTSEANRAIVAQLTAKLGLGPENLIARIAFAYSIASDRRLHLKDIKDSKGKEYSSKVLFGDYLPVYVALVCQRYNLYKTDRDIQKYIKMHIDDGLDLISTAAGDNPNLPLFDFIVQLAEEGLNDLR